LLGSIIIRKSAKLGYRANSSITFASNCDDADCKLCARITSNLGRSQRGDMGECPPSWIEKKLAPELQTDDCFATLTWLCYGIVLVKPKENVQFQRWFFENFLGAMPPDSHTGEGYGAPPQTQPPSAPPRPLGTFRPSIVVSPLIKMLATRLPAMVNTCCCCIRSSLLN